MKLYDNEHTIDYATQNNVIFNERTIVFMPMPYILFVYMILRSYY